jgi:Putative ABC exporter
MRWKAFARRVTRNIKTPKGALFFLLGIGVFGMMIAPHVFLMHKGKTFDPEKLQSTMPFIILGLCAFSLVSSAGERALYFSPGEVSFLFAGPFGRRELLTYKIMGTVFGVAVGSLLFSVLFLRYANSWLGAYVGVFVSFLFINLFTTAAMLLGQLMAEQVYSKGRKLVVAAVAAVVTFGLWQTMSAHADADFLEILKELKQSTAVSYVLLPFEPFSRTITAPALFPDLLLWASVAMGINAALFGIVLAIDAEYREAAVGISQKMANRLQRARKSGMAQSSKATASWSLPRLPWFGGTGPILWRQATNVTRSSKSLIVMAIIVCVGLGAPVLFKSGREESIWPVITGVSIWLTIMLSMMLRFDFRADLDQMEWLKMLPIRPTALAGGELVMPVLISTAVQGVVIAVGAHAANTPIVLPVALAFAIPINTLIFGVENALFLLYPTREAVVTPGDFQAFGRQLLTIMTKMLVVGACSGLAAGIGALVYWLSGRNPLAFGIVAWVVLSAQAAAVLPINAWAFTRYDVSRDTPE